jgi:hypothetical protein
MKIVYHNLDEIGEIRHDNDNDQLKPDWMTTAEFFQWVHRKKTRLRRRLAADFRLRSCPEWLREWEVALEMEKCGLYHLRGQR